ncbi:hypothetical protein [Polyangium sp. 15x6]|uniref:hypothetical protein n=1 Tax=Polyangium sp. 15x6 TaxID=3042687 RepID=UPI00249C0A5C|nr:hypothetical protein [Polyangium sp. 15x6]MDI3291312.1 hypothetical protein [Polyangium sp. 15x6]
MTLKLDDYITQKLTKDRDGVPTQAELDAVWDDVKAYQGKTVRDVGVEGCLEIAARLAKHFEGCVTHMYCDHLGKQTIGIGLLVDSTAKSVLDGLSMTLKSGGGPASAADKQKDWDACAAHFEANKKKPPTHAAYASVTKCKISEETAVAKCTATLKSKSDSLFDSIYPNTRQHKDGYLDYPALAWGLVINLAFAVGNKGLNDFPKMNAAIKAKDWEKAAKESWVSAHSRLTLGARYQIFMLCGGATEQADDDDEPQPTIIYREPTTQYDLGTMSKDVLYDHLREVWKRAQKRFGNEGKAEYDFQDEPGRMNLLGARGFNPVDMKPVPSTNTFYDDCLFLIFVKDGKKSVEKFQCTTEWTRIETDPTKKQVDAVILLGQHKYAPGIHKESDAKRKRTYLDKVESSTDLNGTKYRALRPDPTVKITRVRDAAKVGAVGETADYTEDNGTINIHYGGESEKVTNTAKAWSDGCQVLVSYKRFLDFMELVESDHSIKNTINNERAPKPAKDGTRSLIYTLVEGDFLAPTSASASIRFPIVGKDAEAHYSLNEGGEGGFFPIGANNFWHGGIHLDAASDAVQAIADGDIVAYRINKKALEVKLAGETMRYSNGFVLVRHERYTPKGAKLEFFSLAMHLLPFEEYGDGQKTNPPVMFKKHKFTIATSEDKGGLNVRKTGKGSDVLRVALLGEEVTFKNPNAVAPGGKVGSGWHELATGGFVYVGDAGDPNVKYELEAEPEKFDQVVSCKIPVLAGAVLGYPGAFFTRPATVHFEVLTGDVGFMKNPKGDKGGVGLLQIPPGTKFKTRKATTPPEIKVDMPAGSRLRLVEQPPGDLRKVACADIVGWTKRSSLGDYDKATNSYTLNAPLASLTGEAGGGAPIPIGAKKGDKVVLVLEKKGTDDRQVRYTLPQAEQDKRTGWAERKQLGDWSSPRYTLKSPLAVLYKEAPDGSFTFEEGAGTNAEEIFTEALPAADARVCKDKAGSVWQEVDFGGGKGWVQIEKDAKLLSPYDWPRWQQIEDPSGFSQDGLCDAKGLLALVDKNNDGKVTAEEIKAAVADPAIAQKLRRLACLHPTEWAGEIPGLDRLSGPPWNLDGASLATTREYIKQLGFWGDASSAGLPAKDKVWHLHPIGLIEHWRTLGLLDAAPVETTPTTGQPSTGQPTTGQPSTGGPKPSATESELVVFCKHELASRKGRVKNVTRYEVVSDSHKLDDVVTLLHRGGAKPSPSAITVSYRGEKTTVKGKPAGDGYTQYDVTVTFRGIAARDILSKTFWTSFYTPTEYKVEGFEKPITLAIYRHNKFAVGIAIPKLRGGKEGSRLEKNMQVETRSDGTKGIVWTREKKPIEEAPGWVKPKEPKKKDPLMKGVTITMDGKTLTDEVASVQSILGIVALVQMTSKILKSIQDKVPKIGWYAQWDYQVLQGTFSVEWQMKEYEDHRVYPAVKLNLQFTVFSASAEIGVGVEGCGFNAQVFAKIEGGVGISREIECVSPTLHIADRIPFTLSIVGSVGSRIEAGEWLEFEAVLESGFELQGALEIHVQEGFSMQGSMKWTGLGGKVLTSVGPGGCFGKQLSQQTFIEAVDLGSFKWPEKPYTAPHITRGQIEEILEDKLTDGLNVRVFKPSGSWMPDEQWSMEKIVQTLAAKIDARTDIRRDSTSIEGLAHDIRQRLDILGERNNARDWIKDTTFLDFVNTKLDPIMTATYIDPCKELVDKCK